MTKKIARQAITGAKGVNRIEAAVLDMGFTWTPTPGTLDAGIDGYIEIRDPTTGIATNRIIQVQSKATERKLQGETTSTFDFTCDQRDIDYWLSGNAPVILVVSRPDTNEVYWKALKPYFADPSVRVTRKVRFNKQLDRFDKSCAHLLVELVSQSAAGIYSAALPRDEVLLSNLMQAKVRSQHLYVAPSKFAEIKQAFAALKRVEMYLPHAWFIRGDEVLSLRPFDDDGWRFIAEVQDASPRRISDWSLSDDPVRQREFVRLLGLGLEEALPKEIRHHHERGVHTYYFRPTKDLQDRIYTYISHSQRASATVFSNYLKTSEANERLTGYCRSHAFQGRFHRFDGDWYLQVLPTYWFTDAEGKPHRYAENLMKGIKKLEKQHAIAGQLRLWSYILSGAPLIQARQIVSFAPLFEAPINVGIDDKAWKSFTGSDDNEEAPEFTPSPPTADASPADAPRTPATGSDRQQPLFGERKS